MDFKKTLTLFVMLVYSLYANSTIQFEVFPHPTWYCTVGALHTPRVRFFSASCCHVKPACVSPRPILKHGSPAAVIVHQRQTEKYRGVKQANGTRPTILDNVSSERLGSRSYVNGKGWSWMPLCLVIYAYRLFTLEER